MWSNNTGDANIEATGGQIQVVFFFKIKTGKITRGHDFMLMKGQSRLDVRKYSFSKRTKMSGINNIVS